MLIGLTVYADYCAIYTNTESYCTPKTNTNVICQLYFNFKK